MKDIKDNKLIYNNELFPIAIQYWLPKWLNSAEAWVLIDWRADVNDIYTIIYEWTNKWLITIAEQNWKYKITKLKELPENSKEYEKELFKELCNQDKINVNKIRLWVLDYCVSKWRINDYRSIIWNNINWKLFVRYIIIKLLTPILFFIALFILFIIYAAIRWAILRIIFWQADDHIAISWGDWIRFIAYMILPVYITIRTIIRKINKSRVVLTKEWAKLKSHILWYKKYLKKVFKLNKNDTEKEGILIQEWSMAHTIALNSNNETQLLKTLKKQYTNKREKSYALQLFLKIYSIKFEKFYDKQISQVDINQINDSNKWIIDNIYSERKNLVKEDEKWNYIINYKAIFNYIKNNLKDYEQLNEIYWYSIWLIKKELENQWKKVFLRKR